MPFIRKKRDRVLVVHNRRQGGKVVQKELCVFHSAGELEAALVDWEGWCSTMQWRHPDLRWDFARLRERLGQGLDGWEDRPGRLGRMADGLVAELEKVSGSGAGLSDRQKLRKLRGCLGQVLGDGERRVKRSVEVNAERLFDEAMELWWAGREGRAVALMKDVLKMKDHADAHNHIGLWEMGRKRHEAARTHFEAAVRAAEVQIEGGEVDWGRSENRPYLRGLFNLAVVSEELEQWERAAGLYEKLMVLDPDDHQGARFCVGDCYLGAGRLEDAVQAYGRGTGEPGCAYGLALAQHMRGEDGNAGTALVGAFALNWYVPPMLLGQRWERVEGWHGNSCSEPAWAVDYVERRGRMWRAVPSSSDLLRRWWTAEPVQDWLERMREMTVQLGQLPVGRERDMVVGDLSGLRTEQMARVVASEVDPDATGDRYVHLRRPSYATLDEVTIRKGDGYADIEYHDGSIGSVRMQLDDVDELSDEQILRIHNEIVCETQIRMHADPYVATEVPTGRPQIYYNGQCQQWVPRGNVLRCHIDDGDEQVRLAIDGRLLTLEQVGRMLSTYAGWGMRIEFVDGDDLEHRPALEVREPHDGE